MYGKATETAIGAMSRLAEVYDDNDIRLSAAEIAASRGLPRAFVARILTELAAEGLVTGSRGPYGGFRLARHPREISLYDVYALYEDKERNDACPFGGGVCGVGEPCPLHDKLESARRAFDNVLYRTTFDVFRRAARKRHEDASHHRSKQRNMRAGHRAANRKASS